MRNPKTVKEMFNIIDKIDSNIKEYKYFDKLIRNNEYEVTGVPIRFVLVPIRHLINLEPKVAKCYLKIDEEIIKQYSKILHEILDFNTPNCVRNRIFDAYPESGNIIFNKNSEISKRIHKFEEDLIEITHKYYPKAIYTLKDYKTSEKKGLLDIKLFYNCLVSLQTDFEEEFNVQNVPKKIDEFVDECKMALKSVRFKDSIKEINNYRLFTDEQSLYEWFEEDRTTKILLYTADGEKSKNCKF